VHDDADEEDLEVHEVEEALALYRQRLAFERFERKCRSRYGLHARCLILQP
jgi:hypothetical protein